MSEEKFLIPPRTWDGNDMRKFFVKVAQFINTLVYNYTAGPALSTDNAIARFDGTGGKTIQNSGVIINDDNQMKLQHNTLASAYLGADLDISATPAWYEIGSGAETITESYDYGSRFDPATGRYTCPVAGVYEAVFSVGCKVKDDSQTLVAFKIGLAVNGTPSTVGYDYYGAAAYTLGGTAVFKIACASTTTLSCVVYAAESAGSQPTILGGSDVSRISFKLESTT